MAKYDLPELYRVKLYAQGDDGSQDVITYPWLGTEYQWACDRLDAAHGGTLDNGQRVTGGYIEQWVSDDIGWTVRDDDDE